MKFKIYLLLIFSINFSNHSFAQLAEKPKDDLKNFFKVGGDVFTAPKNFDSNDWIILSSTIGLTAGSFLIDDEIKSFALDNQSSFNDALFEIDNYYHVESMAISIAGIYSYGLIAKDNNVRNLALQLTEVTVYASLINLATKFIIGRARPYMNTTNTDFVPFNFTWEHSSIPSGHTTLSFAYSTVMADVYNNFFWKFGWYTAAALVGYARIYHNAHWFSDVILGGAIGYFVGRFVRNHSTNKKINDLNNQTTEPDFKISFGFSF
jgi:membrane-associated phospholipid phosphatase